MRPRATRTRLTAIGIMALALAMSATASLAQPELWKSQGWSRTDFSKTAIEYSDVLSGGPPKDGIPSIDKPSFKSVPEITTLTDASPVISLVVGDDARAYPLRILIWHEIVNDTVGGVPIAVTYCPLCNAAIVFDRRVGDRVLDFGTTGKLRHSDLIMYDRQTESWWQQFTGEAIVGDLLGQALKLRPSRLESFAEFKARHPDGRVLVPNNPALRPYGRNPYVGYDTAKAPFLYRGTLPRDINPMARVVVIGKRTKPVAVSLAYLRKKGPLDIDGVTLAWRAGQASALDTGDIARGRDVGTVTATRRTAQGTVVDVPYDVTFAFVFHAFHPNAHIRSR